MTDEPEPTTFDMPGDRQYSMIRGIPCFLTREGYVAIMESYALAAEVRDTFFRVKAEAEAQSDPQEVVQKPAAEQRESDWPPHVVKATDDDGNATVGCSYHSIGRGNAKRPRPMRRSDHGGYHCTGKTEKGNEQGYCTLTYTPKGEPPQQEQLPPDESDVAYLDLPF